MKIADFGLSALVRLDEMGYDAEESGKRKAFKELKEVSGLFQDILLIFCNTERVFYFICC